MEVLKKFVKNWKFYLSGDLEPEEISSMTIKRIMCSLNIWRVPVNGFENIRSILSVFSLYLLSVLFCLSGYPRERDIPEWGKFIDILAGIEVSLAKWLFLYWKRDDLTAIIQLMNQKSEELKKRGKTDRRIKRTCNNFYVSEMAVLLFTNVFGMTFLILIFLQVLFARPLQLVVPVSVDMKEILIGPSSIYWTAYAIECFLCPFVALVMTLCDVMIGNIYNQLILHMEVLAYDLRALDNDERASPELIVGKFCNFSRAYHSLRELNKRFEECMRPFFINNILATVLATTFSCVEVGIMINVDPKQCFKPMLYFLFISIPFFYWCWLGSRLMDKSVELAQVAFIYKENASNVWNQKLQLLFMHMVQEPMMINVRPFFYLNFDIFVKVMKIAYQFTAVFKNMHK